MPLGGRHTGPVAEETSSHRRQREIERGDERGAAVGLTELARQLEVPARGLIEDEAARGVEQARRLDVAERGSLRFLKERKKGARRRDGEGLAGEAVPVERQDREVRHESLAAVRLGERPGRARGEKGPRRKTLDERRRL